MNDVLLVRSVMTPFPHAIAVDAPLAAARRAMKRHQIRHLPVKDGDKLVGVVTDRDLKLVLGPNLDEPDDREGPRVRAACVFDVLTVEMTTPLRDVAAAMARRRIGSVLVTKDGRLAGIFTATDACHCLAELLGGPTTDLDPSGGEAA